MSTAHDWVFTSPASEAFSYEKVDVANTTYLGDKYSLKLMTPKAIEKRGTLSVEFLAGDFSGCFGAGCGDPRNIRTYTVSYRKGKLSTSITKASSPNEDSKE